MDRSAAADEALALAVTVESLFSDIGFQQQSAAWGLSGYPQIAQIFTDKQKSIDVDL